MSADERERRGECEDCGSKGPLFKLPTGHDFCINCTEAYISWEFDGGREAAPEMFDWLWEDEPLLSSTGQSPTDKGDDA